MHPFLGILLEDVLQQNKGVKYERGRHGIWETGHLIKEQPGLTTVQQA